MRKSGGWPGATWIPETPFAMDHQGARSRIAVRLHQDEVAISTRGRGLYDVTAEVARVIAAAKVATGLCTVFVQHTSASLVIQENADPAVRRDMEKWIEGIAPEGSSYEHDDEGPDDMPSHLRSVLTKTSETIPITNGKLALGTWQALYLWEHRRAAHTRHLVVHVTGT
jgi:secondary thiamine-phosphate synthase enzyme